MHRFKIHKTDNQSTKRAVDGFNMSRGNLSPRQAPTQPQYYRPVAPTSAQPVNGSLDNFRRPEGWYSQGQSPILTNVAARRETVSNLPKSSLAPVHTTAPQLQGKMSRKQRKQAAQQAGGPRKKSGKARNIKRGVLAFAVLLLVGGGIFAGFSFLKVKGIFKGGGDIAVALNKDVDPSLLKHEGDGRVNILLLGKGGDDHPGGELADTILLASLDPIQNEAGIISIPRDLYVRIPSYGSMKINAAYNTGRSAYINEQGEDDQVAAERAGVQMMEQAVEKVLGIPIHYHIMVDFTAFKEAVDIVGGIDINLEEAIYDPNFDWEYGTDALRLPAGDVHLNGTAALLLGRARGAAGGYGVGTDFDRNANQRKMLIALKDKIFSLGTFGNPAKISSLVSTFSDHVWTDLSTDDLTRLYEVGKSIETSKINSIDLVKPPNSYLTTDMLDGVSVVLPIAGFEEYDSIHGFVANALRDGYLRNEDAQIVVLNGSSFPGLASKKSDELKAVGYTVLRTENAPTSTYESTVIIDLKNGEKKYTKRYLEQRFGVSTGTIMPDASIDTTGADFVIILGANEGEAQ